jgi:hypothetical protein
MKILKFIIIAFILLIIYLLLVGQLSISEFIVGAIISFSISLFIFSRTISNIQLHMDKKLLTPFLFLPEACVKETLMIFKGLFLKCFGSEIAGNTIVIPYEYNNRDPESITKMAIAIFGINVSPNSYVCFFDDKNIHIRQLVGDKISKGDKKFLRIP